MWLQKVGPLKQGGRFDHSAYLDDFETIRAVGEGGFGQVFLMKHKETGQEIAVKRMDISEYRE